MKVSEINYSLDGEGIRAGEPVVIVRLAGCNMRCNWCDTQYAQNGGKLMSIDRIIMRADTLDPSRSVWALITGGEPLLQEDEVRRLVQNLHWQGRGVEIETNGSYDPPFWSAWVDLWSVDVKCPSSGSYGTFRRKWITKMRKQDQLKFVVGDKTDLDFVRGFLSDKKFRPKILVSPVQCFSDEIGSGDKEIVQIQGWLQEVAEFCKELRVRYSLQLHKIIWGNKGGV